MRNRKLLAPALLVTAALVAVGIFAAVSSGGSRGKAVVKTASVGGRTILVNRGGFTLYHLTVERNGRFICTTKACLALWKPLVVARGTTPSGAKSLGTVRRPDGRRQVTYKGGPLYTFAEDESPGSTEGDGFKDVGTWRLITVAGKARSAPSSGSYGY